MSTKKLTITQGTVPSTPEVSQLRTEWNNLLEMISESTNFGELQDSVTTGVIKKIDVDPRLPFGTTVLETEGGASAGTSSFVSPPTLRTLYVRPTGDDTAGDGSLANPFATLVRATRSLPNFANPGERWRIDITGVTEVLPSDFIFPAMKGAFAFGFDPNATLMQRTNLLELHAEPQAWSGGTNFIDVADVAAITVDAITGLTEVQVNSSTWAVDELKGLIFQGSGGASDSAIIARNTVDTLYLSHLGVSGSAGFGPPTAPFNILERTGELQVSGTNSNLGQGGLSFCNIDSFGLRGVKITGSGPSFNDYQVLVTKCVVFTPQFCDINTMQVFGVTGRYNMNYNYFHDGTNWITWAPTSWRFSVIENVGGSGAGGDGGMGGVSSSGHSAFLVVGCRIDGCSPIKIQDNEGRGNGFTHEVMAQGLLQVHYCEILNSTGAAAVEVGSNGEVLNCQINNAAGDAVLAHRGAGLLALRDVRGTGNGGFGVAIDDGMQVRVLDAATSDVTGTGGDLEVGGGTGAVAWVATGNEVIDLDATVATACLGTLSRIARD